MDTTKTKRAPAAAPPSGVVFAFPAPPPRPKLTPLPFYRDATLVPCEGGSGFAIHWRGYRRTLDFTNEPLYWLNDQGALRLTRATVIPWARFFFSQVRGSTGCFDLVEPDDAINWLPATTPAHKELVRNHLRPLRYHGIDAGRHLVSGTVIYSNYSVAALYRVDIRVAPRAMRLLDPDAEAVRDLCAGHLQLCDEVLLANNLGIVIPKPPGH